MWCEAARGWDSTPGGARDRQLGDALGDTLPMLGALLQGTTRSKYASSGIMEPIVLVADSRTVASGATAPTSWPPARSRPLSEVLRGIQRPPLSANRLEQLLGGYEDKDFVIKGLRFGLSSGILDQLRHLKGRMGNRSHCSLPRRQRKSRQNSSMDA